ncbi:MAG: META domain-containing protein [Litorimonas sp.]
MIGKILAPLVVMVALSACQKVLSHSANRPLASLAGTEWGPMQGDLDQFVAFKSEGDVIGSGGCNNFFGSFTQNGRLITFGPLASTKKACPSPIMDAERDFLKLLEQVRAADATFKELTLYGDNNQVLATLRRRDWD